MTVFRSLFATAGAAAISAICAGAVVAQDAAAPDATAAEAAQTGTMWDWDWQTTELPEGKVSEDIVLGDENAPITVIEYASFICNHCGDFHNNVFGDLKSEYIDTGKVRFIQRDVYPNIVALGAGALAQCNGADRFYPIVDMLFTEQSTWMNANDLAGYAANLRKIGVKAGMTDDQINACWSDKQKLADLIATFTTNSARDEVQATPTFVINGETVRNQSWNDLKTVLDAKIAEAG